MSIASTDARKIAAGPVLPGLQPYPQPYPWPPGDGPDLAQCLDRPPQFWVRLAVPDELSKYRRAFYSRAFRGHLGIRERIERSGGLGGILFTRCIFCHSRFRENGVFGRLPPGRRLAFDPERGRLWVVCDECSRWNLCAMEQRWEALHELERLVRDKSQLVAETDNIVLLAAGELFLIRVGKAGLAERSWWRYGRELHQRRSRFHGARSRLTAATFGAMAYLSDVVGLGDDDLSIGWDDTPAADILRWRRFGWAAWHGSVDCPYCTSSLKALRYDLSWWVFPSVDPDTGRTVVEVPCPRCDPWTPKKVYEIGGPEAENVLRRVLAYQHITGATESMIKDASHVIESIGSTEAFETQVSKERKSLWGMGKTRSIALEIALNDSVERRIMESELRSIEFMWKREEELARIIDEQLTPEDVRERHLRRLPVTVLPNAVNHDATLL